VSGIGIIHDRATVEELYLRGRRGAQEVARRCAHFSVVSTVEQLYDLQLVESAELRARRIRCPDCWRELHVRLWRPAAGGCYLQLKEQFAAGRIWNFCLKDAGWVAVG
jgi:hypothetical protein